MRVVHTIEKANAITHGGTFHADDVVGAVILDLWRQAMGLDELKVYRAFGSAEASIPDEAKNPSRITFGTTIAYDVGGGRYDHHQPGGNGRRMNDVPYAACGLIWRDFGMELCKRSSDPTRMWRMVDVELIQAVDAVDCGEMPRTDYPIQPCSLSSVIAAFNPNWDDKISFDDAFEKAVEFATLAFLQVVERAFSNVAAYELINDGIKRSSGHIMVLDKYAPWIGPVMHPSEDVRDAAANLLFVVYPANRGGYQWRGIPDRDGSYGLRKAAPTTWWGLKGEELQKVCGVATAKFCHPNGFIGGADTLEDTILMARLAVKA